MSRWIRYLRIIVWMGCLSKGKGREPYLLLDRRSTWILFNRICMHRMENFNFCKSPRARYKQVQRLKTSTRSEVDLRYKVLWLSFGIIKVASPHFGVILMMSYIQFLSILEMTVSDLWLRETWTWCQISFGSRNLA